MIRVTGYMQNARGRLSRGDARIDAGLTKLAAFRAAAPAKLREAAADLQKRLLDTLAVGMTRIQRKGTKNAEPHVVRQEKMAPDVAPQGGAARRAEYGDSWPKGDINRSVEEFAGPDPMVMTTDKGKRIYENPDTGVQVVEDINGEYYRVYDPSLPGRRKYLDLDGSIPNNKIVDGRQVGRTQSEYNQVTHFRIEK